MTVCHIVTLDKAYKMNHRYNKKKNRTDLLSINIVESMQRKKNLLKSISGTGVVVVAIIYNT